MMGQAVHFHRYTPEPVPYGAWRYGAECRRLNHVLEKQLVSNAPHPCPSGGRQCNNNPPLAQSTSPYVAGDRPTMADFAVFVYAHSAKWCGIDVSDYPHVQAWCEALANRPGVQRGLQFPTPYVTSDEGVVSPANQDTLRRMRAHFSKAFKEASDRWWQGSKVVSLPSDHANHGDGGAH